jgi:molybdopterin-synthase adenylyltransferase
MPGATQRMVEQQWKKVDYVKHLIKKIYQTGSCVTTIPTSIDTEVAKSAIATSDLISIFRHSHHARLQFESFLQHLRSLRIVT